jgi:hydroxymethylpyrimidine pyrophosphatase-like HAD family hydrolase
MPKGIDKGSALARIADILGVNAGEVMAIGDSMNDEAMIRWAGMGVAMANGDAHIKNIAGLVTDNTNDDDGVAEVIEKYFLERTRHE